ncbi:MAG: hypothetical protein ABSC42_09855 [Tepidisphaeraceae bacterium]|jgi:2-iminoacetate synthase ThiH
MTPFFKSREMNFENIDRLIREAGKIPVERDTLYRQVRPDQHNRVLLGASA